MYTDPHRLVFNPKIGDYYQHINKLANCRLFFDAPKYNAHTSAGDAIWAGVPVISGKHIYTCHSYDYRCYSFFFTLFQIYSIPIQILRTH